MEIFYSSSDLKTQDFKWIKVLINWFLSKHNMVQDSPSHMTEAPNRAAEGQSLCQHA